MTPTKHSVFYWSQVPHAFEPGPEPRYCKWCGNREPNGIHDLGQEPEPARA